MNMFVHVLVSSGIGEILVINVNFVGKMGLFSVSIKNHPHSPNFTIETISEKLVVFQIDVCVL